MVIKEALVLRPVQQPETPEDLVAETLESNKKKIASSITEKNWSVKTPKAT
jgi:hypothetical protein